MHSFHQLNSSLKFPRKKKKRKKKVEQELHKKHQKEIEEDRFINWFSVQFHC